MEKIKQPDVVYSEPMEDIKQYQGKIRKINDRLREIAEHNKQFNKQLDDLLEYNKTASPEKKDSFFASIDSLKYDVELLNDERLYIEELRNRYITLIRQASEDDIFLQQKMDDGEAGNA